MRKANPADKIVQTIPDSINDINIIKFKTFPANEDFSTIVSDHETNSSYDKFRDIYKQGFDTTMYIPFEN